MTISKKKLIGISSILFAIVIFCLFGTLCFQYKATSARGDFFTVYDFGYGGNITIEAILATLVSIIGAICAFNFVSLFVEQISEKMLGIINISLWAVALVFSITALFGRYININYIPTISMTFVLLTTIVAIGFTIFSLVHTEE